MISSGHPILLEGMKVLLRGHPKIRLVGESRSVSQAVENVTRFHPDVVLLDITPGDYDALGAVRQIKDNNPAVPILGMAVSGEIESTDAYINAGLSGFIPHQTGTRQLLQFIEIQQRSAPVQKEERRKRRRDRRKSGLGSALLDNRRLR